MSISYSILKILNTKDKHIKFDKNRNFLTNLI